MGVNRRGYVSLVVVVAVVMVAAATAGQRPFLTYFSFNGLGSMAPLWVLPPLIWLAIITGKLVLRRADHPLTKIWRTVRRHRYWLLRGIAFTVLALPLGRAFSAFKASIPTHTAYWADPFIADSERFLLFGNDGWQITHALIGPTGTALIDAAYVLWFFVMMGLLGWLNFTGNAKLQLHGLLTYILTWFLLGMVGAMALASVGPIFFDQFYGGERFSVLRAVLDEQPNLKMHGAAAFLYENRAREVIGSGISAMPSLHVAITWILVLVCREAGLRPTLQWLARGYCLVIFVGSVHLGWHYAMDGLASIIGVSAIWLGVGRFLEP